MLVFIQDSKQSLRCAFLYCSKIRVSCVKIRQTPSDMKKEKTTGQGMKSEFNKPKRFFRNMKTIRDLPQTPLKISSVWFL